MQQVKRGIELISFGLYLLVGFYGALWVSDEFDRQRLSFYAFFAVPTSVIFIYSLFVFPEYWKSRPRLKQISSGVIGVSYVWGVLLWVNAISLSMPTAYTRVTKSQVEQKSLRVAYRKGGFGWLYRLRW